MYKASIFFILIQISISCPDDQRCASCQGSVCNFCWNSFLYQGRCYEPYHYIDNCLQYDQQGNCAQCDYKYYVDNYGKCKEVGRDYCLQVDQLNTCIQCKQNIRVDYNGFCYEENECETENCDFCRLNPNGTERCVRCEEDYVLVLNQGFENQVNRCIERESDRLENCLEANQNLTCFKCEYGFYDKNGQCVESEEYSNANIIKYMSAIFVSILILQLI